MVSHVKGCDSDRITSGNNSGRSDGCVEEDEREHSIEHGAEVGSVLLVLDCQLTFLALEARFTYQVHNDLAVRVGLEGSRVLEALSQCDVVVDLSVNGEHNRPVLVDQRLSTSVC